MTNKRRPNCRRCKGNAVMRVDPVKITLADGREAWKNSRNWGYWRCVLCGEQWTTP